MRSREPPVGTSSYSTFIGLIANADNEIVQLVEEMVVSHIKGNCLILVALPMTGAAPYLCAVVVI